MSERIFVIGDIHGCYDELMQLLEKMNVKEEDHIISVGDIVDRGPDSVKVYDFFRSRKNATVLMGNHERKHIAQTLSYAQEIVKLQFGERYDEFIEWIKKLPYHIDTEHALVVHAAFEHDVELSKQREDVLAGSTSGERHLEKRYGEKYWTDFYDLGKPVIFGHHVVGTEVKKFGKNIYGIDTGACHGDFLSAIELPSFSIHSVKAAKDHWVEELQKWQLPVLKNKPWLTFDIERIEKELDKAGNSKNEEVIRFIEKVREWIAALNANYEELREAIIDKANSILRESGAEDFSKEAMKYEYKTFLFLARNNRLKKEEIRKSLDTPQKILSLARKLEVAIEPFPIGA